MSFTSIGERYGLTTQRVIQIFDDKIKYIPQGKNALCFVYR